MTRPAEVRVSRSGIEIDGERLLSARKIARAYTQPRAEAAPSVCCVDDAGVLVASEAVASPRLRIALEAAADPDSEELALEQALESFDEQQVG